VAKYRLKSKSKITIKSADVKKWCSDCIVDVLQDQNRVYDSCVHGHDVMTIIGAVQCSAEYVVTSRDECECEKLIVRSN